MSSSQLKKDEKELSQEWLCSFSDCQLVCNEGEKRFGDKALSKWCICNTIKNLLVFVFTFGGFLFQKCSQVSSDSSIISTLGELKELNSSKSELAEVQSYFQSMEESEKRFKGTSETEMEPWAKKIIESSLSVLPYNSYEDIVVKKKDTYLKWLHYYACFISVLISAGLVLFYMLFKKLSDKNYKFLETSMTKHVIESSKFENYLSELLTKSVGFDSLASLSHSYTKSLEDVAYNSQLTTNVFKTPILKILFFLTLSLITGGLFPLYMYWVSVSFNKEQFCIWWMSRKVLESQMVEPLGNIARKWWGSGIKTLRKLWVDLSLSTYMSEITNSAISTNFFQPKVKLSQLNWAVFWMFTSPLGKWMMNVLLLLVVYAFLMVWSFQYSWAMTAWPLYAVMVSGTFFLLLLGYHLYLIV